MGMTEDIHRVDLTRYLVAPSRLRTEETASGRSSGDIYSSYSGDVIPEGSRVRKPFKWQGQLWVTVSLCSEDGVWTAKAYRLIPKATFQDIPTTYWGKTRNPEDAEAARHDPMGFYHGMTVGQGGDAYVLSGPPAIFSAGSTTDELSAMSDEPILQLSLF